MRASLLGAPGALALVVGAAAAWQSLGATGLAVEALALGLIGLIALRRPRLIPRFSTAGARRAPLILGVSVVVGPWLAATVFTLTSPSEETLPPSGERVAEIETNVDGLVAAVELLGGGDEHSHDEGPPTTPAFPIAGPDSTSTPTPTPNSAPAFLPTLDPTTVATETATPASAAPSSFDFNAPAATSTSTVAAGSTPSPLSQPRVSSGPDGGPLDTAGANLYNCTDFESWEQAVAVFRASGASDPNRLDTDGNGIPCEDLKAAELNGS